MSGGLIKISRENISKDSASHNETTPISCEVKSCGAIEFVSRKIILKAVEFEGVDLGISPPDINHAIV